MIYVKHLVAIFCVAAATYLARYLPLKYYRKIAKIRQASSVFRRSTIAILTSLVVLSLTPAYTQHDVSTIIAATSGIVLSIILAKKLHNIGLIAILGLLTYLLVYKILQLLLFR